MDASNNSNNHALAGLPRRVLLVGMPRTASNLLIKILTIPGQPDALSNEQGGYFFFPAFEARLRDDLTSKPLAQWTSEQTCEVHRRFQQSLDSLGECSAPARAGPRRGQDLLRERTCLLVR
jgi:hypothetical protein